MFKCLSGLDEEQLNYFVERIRYIASLGDEAATIEADKFIWEIANSFSTDTENESESSWRRDELLKEMESIIQSTDALIEKFNQDIPFEGWEVDSLERRAELLGENLDEALTNEFSDRIGKIQENVFGVVNQFRRIFCKLAISELLNQPIYNVSSAQSILRQLESASEFLKSSEELDSETQQMIRKAKERAARYRANKKLAEAEVAEGGGNSAKASRLRGEARVILSQDWAAAFPGERAPTL